MTTSNPRVFAVGDSAATLQLARVADQEAHVAAASIIGRDNEEPPPSIDYRVAPAMLFTYPMLGMKHAAYKVLVDGDSKILGAHILADNATGLINTFKQAMLDGTTVAELHKANIMSPYPSRESDIVSMLAPLLD